MGIILVGFECREYFPNYGEHVKANFGILFTPLGRAVYLILIGFLSFSQGWFGIVIGVLFLCLAMFNFFLIYKHPGYKEAMTLPSINASQRHLGAVQEEEGEVSTQDHNTVVEAVAVPVAHEQV